MPNFKSRLAETLMSMPNVGEDSDFARVDDSNDKRLAARQMQDFMTTTPCAEQLDLKALIDEGRAGDAILDAMIDQMNQTTASAEAAIDNALAEIDASNQRLESMERKANGNATKEASE